MATGQLYYNVRMADGSLKSSDGVTESNFFGSNIVSLANVSRFTRIGIQAPPGTKVVLNQTRTIMIGRTGIYELEANITSLVVIRLVNYNHLTDEENADKRAGLLAMIAAENTWHEYLMGLTIPNEGEPWTIDDDALVDAERAYQTTYQGNTDPVTAHALYMTGYNGIYEQDADKPYVDVENVIIDYQYE